MAFRGIGTYTRGSWSIAPDDPGVWVITCGELPDFRQRVECSVDTALELLRGLVEEHKRLKKEDSK